MGCDDESSFVSRAFASVQWSITNITLCLLSLTFQEFHLRPGCLWSASSHGVCWSAGSRPNCMQTRSRGTLCTSTASSEWWWKAAPRPKLFWRTWIQRRFAANFVDHVLTMIVSLWTLGLIILILMIIIIITTCIPSHDSGGARRLHEHRKAFAAQ